ncbi:NADH pyrophosphatase [Schizosaccharomyces pombe]|uniref:NAD-capped RNA hydrolase n=1 Tax=Schizosaccharomyces pombe (strain 972 / ATCC 24843) TaxID=284812 RepID=NPY1_SCHPO|nr:putative NADH pyrophosphatase [Schizosaccharomyces pombe]Q9Y7J0.1 RecName: Full=NAD-capped RNA hydrolase; Short=DeNADding enzyme; AltName: Full=Probable NADH pyrophosphatase [Schizosaccharomyces pombe 972h-]CAB39798.1 NADH pyrophosphatase (predicted) [Schizosaccharomyces pombe]|eukprot:NP_596286.1 putative NADH pyrophosphatase [Schizosaccharomyces pombe]
MQGFKIARHFELPTAPSQFFAGSSLNRLSFLRSNREFLNKAFYDHTTRFLPFCDLNPALLVKDDKLVTLSYPQISKYFTFSPFEHTDKQIAERFSKGESLPVLVYMGNEERNGPTDNWSQHNVFAIDITGIDELQQSIRDNGGTFVNLRSIFTEQYQLSASDSGACAFARSILDWISRYRFCPGCGKRNIPTMGGTKLVCSDVLLNDDSNCPSKKGINNYQYPRTDPCVIMVILSHDMQHILLGRALRHPKGLYACLAGFLEPGESLEEAVVRETYEESGVDVEKVLYYASQPWPFPQSLMLACFGIARKNAKIQRDKDLELEDVRFFSREEVLRSLEWDAKDGPAPILFPPKLSIARNLIQAFAYDDWTNSQVKM